MSAEAALKRWRGFLVSWAIGFPAGVLLFSGALWAICSSSLGAALLVSAACALPVHVILPSLYLQVVRQEPTSPEIVARAEAAVATFHRWLGRALGAAIGLALFGMGYLYGWLGPLVVVLCLLPISPFVLFAWLKRRRSRAA